MRVEPVVLVVLMACGRLSFDRTAPASSGGDSAVTDTVPDSYEDPCAPNDDTCRAECLGTDPDCITTCGDGRCVGNAGELCVTCEDCNTQATACGNGACDPSEDSGSCYPDCGPKPWTWDPEEEDMLTRINNARTGTVCPPGGLGLVGSPVVRETGLDAGAREWAWEATYHRPLNSDACNGRTSDERVVTAGAVPSYEVFVAVGPADTQTAMTNWLADMAACNAILNNAYTRVGIGVSFINGERAYVLILD